MALTKAQIANVNRQNAARSTGPRTPAGKFRSSRNAQSHGATSRQIVFIDDEEKREAEGKYAQLIREFDPQSHYEFTQVDFAVEAHVCYARAVRAENAQIADHRDRQLLDWDLAEKTRLDRHVNQLAEDISEHGPALEGFGAGLRWKLQGWETLRTQFETLGYLDDYEQYHLAAQLLNLSSHLDDQVDEPDSWLLQWHFLHAMPMDQDVAEGVAELRKPAHCPPCHKDRHAPPQAQASAFLKSLIEKELTRLTPLEEALSPLEDQQRDWVAEGALMLEGTDADRFEKYKKNTTARYERAVSILSRAKAERETRRLKQGGSLESKSDSSVGRPDAPSRYRGIHTPPASVTDHPAVTPTATVAAAAPLPEPVVAPAYGVDIRQNEPEFDVMLNSRGGYVKVPVLRMEPPLNNCIIPMADGSTVDLRVGRPGSPKPLK